MSWCQTGRILLVWPDKGSPLNNPLDLKLVKRYAASIGSQLAVVTQDSEVRFYARQLGISVFRNLHLAHDHSWENDQRKKIVSVEASRQDNLESIRNHSPSHPTVWSENPILKLFCLGMSVVALSLLGVFLLPGAKITLAPKVVIQTINFDLTVNPAQTSVNLSTGSLPTYSMEVIVEGSDTVTATGSMSFPDKPAVGDLKFTNISKQAIKLPTGTIVSTQGKAPIRFIILTSADVMIGPNKSQVIAARAIKPGTEGNLRANKLLIIEGVPETDLTVTNPSATHAGSDATVPTPTTQDLQILRARLIDRLRQSALVKMQSILPDGDILITPTLTMVETIEETAIPLQSEPGNNLKVSLSVRLRSQAVSRDVLHRLVSPVLDASTPVGYISIDNSLELTHLSQPSLSQDGIIHWTVSATRKLQVNILASQATEIVKGMTVAHAKETLANSLPLNSLAQIELTPKWWPRLPYLAMRIQVNQAEIP